MELKPFDIVLLDGQLYKPYHWPIQWRGLDRSVHCFPIMEPASNILESKILDIEFKGLEDSVLSEYIGRRARIYRYKYVFDNRYDFLDVYFIYDRYNLCILEDISIERRLK